MRFGEDFLIHQAFQDREKSLSLIHISLLPIVLFFGAFQLLVLRLPGRSLLKILVGLVYTYIGLVLFLTGVNVDVYKRQPQRCCSCRY